MSGRDVLAVRVRPTLDPSTLLRVSGPLQGGRPRVLPVGRRGALGAWIPDRGPELRKGGVVGLSGLDVLAVRGRPPLDPSTVLRVSGPSPWNGFPMGSGMTRGWTLEEGGDFVGHEVHLAHEGVVGFDAVADEVEDEMVEARVQVV